MLRARLICLFSRLFIPIEEKSESNGWLEQHIYVIDKDENGNVTTKKEYGVKYVPLTDAPEYP
jgi:protein-L-isoaspartate(D-aspartate) O-methyltransferase